MYDVQAKSAVQMGNGYYLVTGTQAFSNGFLSVHASNGLCINTTFLSQGALSSYSELHQITKINDTLALISGKISLAGGPSEVWKGITMAVNDQGQQLWSLTFNLSDAALDATITDVERKTDSTFLVLCSSIGNSLNTLSEIDILGNVQWTKSYETNDPGFQLSDVCIQDSLVFACGNRYNVGVHSGIILRLDSLGNLEDGWNYTHSVQPDFIQLLASNQGLVVANRGHAMSAVDVLKVDYSGNVVSQKSFPINMGMPEAQALKPLAYKDSLECWYWSGGDFGSYAYLVDVNSLLPIQGISHMGNIQTIIDHDTTLQILASGPLYGIKNQVILQKHYAITSADSLESLYAFCTYPTNEQPLNELAPVKISFSPTVGIGTAPNPFFYPLVQNQPWINEPFCVEMLGGMEEEQLIYGPNPCDPFITIMEYPNQPYTILTLIGQCKASGETDSEGRIQTIALPSGTYYLKVGNRSLPLQVQH
ncbi:MAG: T9SS type A sorting domain-containing protein [Flavobacteriales bacterium]